MSGVYVVTDSSSDLTEEEVAELDVEIVPLTVRIDTDEFVDRRDLGIAEFYKRMAASDDLPQTACPSPGAFEEAFNRAAEAGADAVVCITISSELPEYPPVRPDGGRRVQGKPARPRGRLQVGIEWSGNPGDRSRDGGPGRS